MMAQPVINYMRQNRNLFSQMWNMPSCIFLNNHFAFGQYTAVKSLCALYEYKSCNSNYFHCLRSNYITVKALLFLIFSWTHLGSVKFIKPERCWFIHWRVQDSICE